MNEAGLPREPADGNAVRDRDGDVWQRRSSHWFMASGSPDNDGLSWATLLDFGPLRLLMDGPVLARRSPSDTGSA